MKSLPTTAGGQASCTSLYAADMVFTVCPIQLQTTRLDPTDEDVGDLEVVVIQHDHVVVTENGAGRTGKKGTGG